MASTIALYNFDGRIAIRGCNDKARVDHIPPAVYRIQLSMEGIDLVPDRKKFDTPAKIFGRAEEYATRIVDDFVSRKDQATGAILNGLKGNGKTLTAELIGNKLLSRDMPVIIVDEPMPANLLLQIARLCAPCMLQFDEFGKVYSDDRKETNEREGLLPLFSDSSLKQVLFVVTSNTREELNTFILDRPTRFKYFIDFVRMSPAEVSVVLDDFKLTSVIRHYMEVYCVINAMSYDMIMTMAKHAENCHTRDDLIDMFHMLNVPNGWSWQVGPDSIYMDTVQTTYTVTLSKALDTESSVVLSDGHVVKFAAGETQQYWTINKAVAKAEQPKVTNSPDGVKVKIASSSQLVKGVQFVGDAVWTQDNGTSVVKLYNEEGDMIKEFEINLETDVRKDQGELINKNGQVALVKTNVHPAPGLRVKLSIKYGAEDGKRGVPINLTFAAGEAPKQKKETVSDE